MSTTAAAPIGQKLTLDQIAANFQAIDSLLAESGGEATPEIEAWFTEYDLAEQQKVDGYVFYIRALEGECKAIKALEDELAGKRKTVANRIEYLKRRVADYLTVMGKDEVRGDIYRFKFQNNGGEAPVEVLVQPEDLPAPLTNVKVTPNLDAIRQGLLSGSIQPTVARFGPRGRHLRII
jgi:hypothetical protein